MNIPAVNRRKTERLTLHNPLPAKLGTQRVRVVDLSANGAKVVHHQPFTRDAERRFMMWLNGQRFAARARVVSCRITGLNAGPDGSPAYETRLLFLSPARSARALLAIYLVVLARHREQLYFRNAYGIGTEPINPIPVPTQFLRLRMDRGTWLRVRTHDPAQPPDGLTLPATVPEAEVSSLCAEYERAPAEHRDLMRAIAVALATP